ncbi:hypothetical protein PIB30_003955 [Stylosanthes scabra]|uniref:Uncharacterized protein n=1 Tax=Stylosanthes scabra TaxID=79078 RepID=A0ABU6V5F6_9FABA|nr:hypothetical protein [Stylosanthes scabra]
MENDSVSSGSQRSGSGVRAERSSSSTQGFFAAKVGNERDGAIGGPHCKFLLWLDEHAAKFDKKESVKCEEGEDVNMHFATLNIVDRLRVLEDRVATMEKRKGMNMFLIVTGLVVGLILMWASRA